MEGHDSLSYGVVIERLDGGEWWHGHVVRSELEYHSDFLGRRTNLLFVMRKLGRGATAKSPEFYLTLDAEGVCGELCPVRFNGDWGERGDDPLLKREASHIQDDILPLLHASEEFQRAMAVVVRCQAYGKVAGARKFSRISDHLGPGHPGA